MVSGARTSQSHPLRIAEVAPRDGRGLIGLSLCPGKVQPRALTGAWARDIDIDVAAIAAWGASHVITLVTDAELDELGVAELGKVVRRHGMTWHHLAIDDYAIPDGAFEAAWPATSAVLHQALDEGGRVLVHCKGGLGRAGSVAAMMLVERGDGPGMALNRVREVRPGAVETDAQETYVICHAAVGPHRRDAVRSAEEASKPSIH